MRFLLSTLLIVAVAAALVMAGCSGTATSDAPRKPRVIATTSILGDWVAYVGGGDVDLKTLVGPDGDPHEYEPVPDDSVRVGQADVLFANGLGLENWLDKLYASSGSNAKRVVLTDAIDVRRVPAGESASGPAGEADPHAWQDPHAAAQMVRRIRDALAAADPPHAAGYQARGDAYAAQLDALDRWAAEQFTTIPPVRRKLVTSHDAFGYLGRRYDIDVSRSALESVTTEASDPSARQFAEVVAQVKASGVPVIFLENVQNRKLIDQLAAAADVQIGPPLYSDALGPPGSAGDTYEHMIQYNVRTLVEALR